MYRIIPVQLERWSSLVGALEWCEKNFFFPRPRSWVRLGRFIRAHRYPLIRRPPSAALLAILIDLWAAPEFLGRPCSNSCCSRPCLRMRWQALLARLKNKCLRMRRQALLARLKNKDLKMLSSLLLRTRLLPLPSARWWGWWSA